MNTNLAFFLEIMDAVFGAPKWRGSTQLAVSSQFKAHPCEVSINAEQYKQV